jgi:hypothetical protein
MSPEARPNVNRKREGFLRPGASHFLAAPTGRPKTDQGKASPRAPPWARTPARGPALSGRLKPRAFDAPFTGLGRLVVFRACFKNARGSVFAPKALWRGAPREHPPSGAVTEGQRSQRAFGAKTLRAAVLLAAEPLVFLKHALSPRRCLGLNCGGLSGLPEQN